MSNRSGAVPTIVEVAEKAGVSIKTVSRVLNNEANVREETRDAVLRAATEMNYRPKLSARSLAGGRSFLIGLLYYEPSAAFVAGVQQGATLQCRKAGYHLVVEALGNAAHDVSLQVGHMLAALRPDGVILTPPICDNADVLAALEAARTPCVLMSPGQGGRQVPHVRMDDVLAAKELTELLIGLGHRRIAFIKGATDQAASAWRLRGFRQAMRAHGIDVDEALIAQGDFRFPSGEAAAHQLLRGSRRPSAVFASNDDMALGVLAAAHRLGVQVPDELSVVGFDDSPAASLVWPTLTTVRQPVMEMAEAAVDMLISGLAPAESDEVGKPSDRAGVPARVLAHQLVPRESTGPAPRRAAASGAKKR